MADYQPHAGQTAWVTRALTGVAWSWPWQTYRDLSFRLEKEAREFGFITARNQNALDPLPTWPKDKAPPRFIHLEEATLATGSRLEEQYGDGSFDRRLESLVDEWVIKNDVPPETFARICARHRWRLKHWDLRWRRGRHDLTVKAGLEKEITQVLKVVQRVMAHPGFARLQRVETQETIEQFAVYLERRRPEGPPTRGRGRGPSLFNACVPLIEELDLLGFSRAAAERVASALSDRRKPNEDGALRRRAGEIIRNKR